MKQIYINELNEKARLALQDCIIHGLPETPVLERYDILENVMNSKIKDMQGLDKAIDRIIEMGLDK